ncbi:MAG TPA: NmrA family NAD(P)-binding protein [Mycobacterium sp.]|nr:NmrA family NAD(P)-binding protein [Mycobacterium sp.]
MITLAGGTGLVGKSLTQALMRDGEQVRVLTRDPTTAAAAFGDAKLEIVGVDAITRDNLYAMPSPTVFDLTGHPPRSVKDWLHEHVSLFAAPAT